MIIAITGTNAAGKDTAAEYLVKKGFTHFSLSDELREIARERGLEPTRENLIALGNELRRLYGTSFLTKRILEKASGTTHIVLSSVRNPGELEPVKNTDGFRLIAIDAPSQVRYERAKARGRISENVSLESFIQMDAEEMHGGDTEQNLARLIDIADFKIVNDGSFNELYKKLDDAVGPLAKPKRASWDEYFMNIAKQVATRSTCDRKRCGAVIVRDRVILSTGYNGSIIGLPHCDDVGHMIENGHCVRTVHAEMNAVAQAAKNGVNINGSTIYITASPCWICFKLLCNAGIKRICYGEFYRDDRIFEAARQAGVELVDLSHTLAANEKKLNH